ncbi:MAG TPA: alpha/beta fold hydrolase [Chloroflexia bacterium]|nr:alpha/beta fold hydrolase [Chloroflexia bacterium]
MRKRIGTLTALALGTLLLSACGTAAPAPTAAPAGARAITFTTEDGVILSGTLRGSGRTAVIFSHMSDGPRSQWRDLPERLADRGYMTLAYDFRGRGESGGEFSPPAAPDDLRAAVAFVREQGAQSIALVGASMGGMASARIAAAERPSCLVFVAGTTSWNGLEVSDAEMAANDTPKLFISSDEDAYINETLHLYDAAAEPKEKHIYPGGAHGTNLFDSHAEDFSNRIISFIEANAPR